MSKKDMSSGCMPQFERNPYEAMVIAVDRGEITYEEFRSWYCENCAKCKWMCEICMYGEE